MKSLVLLVLALIAVKQSATLNVVSQENISSAPLPANGAALDEVVVESSLYIKPKAKSQSLVRRVRHILELPVASQLYYRRVKRHPQWRGQSELYGQSQAASNAAANSHQQGPEGFASGASNAGAQAFNAFGPSGVFGAAAAGTATQTLSANKFGLQNSAGASASQSYTLPNGQTINFASTNSFANGPAGNNANSRGAAVSVGRG